MPSNPSPHLLTPAELANAVSGFGVIFSGAVLLILSTFVWPQHPARWR